LRAGHARIGQVPAEERRRRGQGVEALAGLAAGAWYGAMSPTNLATGSDGAAAIIGALTRKE
jgi:hypothetical protein